MNTITPEKGIPIYSYLDTIEEGAKEQATLCSQLPHAYHHIALMPDAHQGYAMPVGGVMALSGAVMPNAVGVDIGCGMIAMQTTLERHQVQGDIRKLADAILRKIPVGFDKHPRPQMGSTLDFLMAKGKEKKKLKQQMPVLMEHADEVPYQLGSLGGGNHFIEIQADEHDYIWVMLHSGSRNIGLKIANTYHKIAKSFCENSPLPKDYAFLPLELPEAQQYLREMQWAMDFAMENRITMIQEVLRIIGNIIRVPFQTPCEVRTHHNYAAWETHYGEKVLVHRKGAVRARKGEYVTIPGSMGTASYIGIGKGFVDSFESCSHGAGRQKGRKQALREISEHDLQKQLGQVYVATPKISRIRDEAPAAYKNIDQVMKLQENMVSITHRLVPLAVVKG